MSLVINRGSTLVFLVLIKAIISYKQNKLTKDKGPVAAAS